MRSTWGNLRLFLFSLFAVVTLWASGLRAQELRVQDFAQDSVALREDSKFSATTVAPLGDAFVRLARLGDWAECRGDYTPPAWCRDLPGQLNTSKSFTSSRARRAEEKQSLSRANLNLARALEKFLIAAVRAGGADVGADVSVSDFRVIETAALNGNAEAMEMMAWMYMQDIVPEFRRRQSSRERAYLWYGKALLAGMAGVKKDMDTLWVAMTREERRRMIEYFDKDRVAQIPGLS